MVLRIRFAVYLMRNALIFFVIVAILVWFFFLREPAETLPGKKELFGPPEAEETGSTSGSSLQDEPVQGVKNVIR